MLLFIDTQQTTQYGYVCTCRHSTILSYFNCMLLYDFFLLCVCVCVRDSEWWHSDVTDWLAECAAFPHSVNVPEFFSVFQEWEWTYLDFKMLLCNISVQSDFTLCCRRFFIFEIMAVHLLYVHQRSWLKAFCLYTYSFSMFVCVYRWQMKFLLFVVSFNVLHYCGVYLLYPIWLLYCINS